MVGGMVSGPWGHCNKVPQTGGLQATEMDSPTVLELEVKVKVSKGPCPESLQIESFPTSSSLLVIPGNLWQSVLIRGNL